MLRRIALVLVTAVTVLPFLVGSASASCVDQVMQSGIQPGYYDSEKSQYWYTGYVQVDGTANVTVHGNELISDATLSGGDWIRWTSIVATNGANVTLNFVTCVAG